MKNPKSVVIVATVNVELNANVPTTNAWDVAAQTVNVDPTVDADQTVNVVPKKNKVLKRKKLDNLQSIIVFWTLFLLLYKKIYKYKWFMSMLNYALLKKCSSKSIMILFNFGQIFNNRKSIHDYNYSK